MPPSLAVAPMGEGSLGRELGKEGESTELGNRPWAGVGCKPCWL